MDASNDNGNSGMSLCYPHNSGLVRVDVVDFISLHELVNSYQVDANGLPYLNGEYRAKPSVTTKTRIR